MQIQVLSPQFLPQYINPYTVQPAVNEQYLQYFPPLKPKETIENQNFIIPPLLPQMLSSSDSDTETEKGSLKERNRLAAQKWRQKKELYLGDLETTNDQLRQQALELRNVALSLKVQNKILEDELQFFQSFMSKIMKPQSS